MTSKYAVWLQSSPQHHSTFTTQPTSRGTDPEFALTPEVRVEQCAGPDHSVQAGQKGHVMGRVKGAVAKIAVNLTNLAELARDVEELNVDERHPGSRLIAITHPACRHVVVRSNEEDVEWKIGISARLDASAAVGESILGPYLPNPDHSSNAGIVGSAMLKRPCASMGAVEIKLPLERRASGYIQGFASSR